MRDVPVVVVLGERGAGKSVALEQEHDLLSSQMQQRLRPCCIWAGTSPIRPRQAARCISTCTGEETGRGMCCWTGWMKA